MIYNTVKLIPHFTFIQVLKYSPLRVGHPLFFLPWWNRRKTSTCIAFPFLESIKWSMEVEIASWLVIFGFLGTSYNTKATLYYYSHNCTLRSCPVCNILIITRKTNAHEARRTITSSIFYTNYTISFILLPLHACFVLRLTDCHIADIIKFSTVTLYWHRDNHLLRKPPSRMSESPQKGNPILRFVLHRVRTPGPVSRRGGGGAAEPEAQKFTQNGNWPR